jgi:hypothetical protein
MSTAYKRAAIGNLYGDASVVTDLNKSAERQRAMRRRHSRAIQTPAVRRAMTAKTVRSAIDARHFGTRGAVNR